jgi:hypothetical protein
MRKDMFKVIVERPRTGRRYERAKHTREANKDYDDLPRREGMRQRTNQSKQLNENLKPLERYFKSQVGRPWDNIFSEVCENISLDSTVQRHVREHVPHMVHLEVLIKDGKIYDKRYYSRGDYSELWHGDLYVHPETKILRRYKSERRRNDWRRKSSPESVLKYALEQLDVVLFQGELYKAERSKPKSAKYDKEKVSMVKANATHAANDVRTIPTALRVFWNRHLTRQLYRDHEYLRVAVDLLHAADERRKAQKEAELRKALEAQEKLKKALAEKKE